MAIEWYLLKPPYSQTSGFEDEVMDFGKDAFSEALDSPIALDVEYCNADLSVCIPIKAVIQNSVQDTKLNAFTRHILAPIGTCKAGNYIKYKNRYWLIVGLVDDNGMYEKAVLKLCNWLMSWINQNGKVIERWAYIESASQYNNGERDNKLYTIRTDQLLVNMPDDDECLILDTGKRFIIDKRIQVYEKSISDEIDTVTSFNLITYELTRNDSVLFNYGDSGHYEILVTQDEQHNEDGFYRIGDKGYWLCPESRRGEKVELSQEQENDEEISSEVVSSEIIHDDNVIYIGQGASEFTAIFYNEEGNPVNGEAEWNIICDFIDKLQIDYINNTILIATNNYSLLNKSFQLSLNNETRIDIKIVALL